MKRITLTDVINEQLKDRNFSDLYEREMLINRIAKIVVRLGQTKQSDRNSHKNQG